jgi:hypothetical protein
MKYSSAITLSAALSVAIVSSTVIELNTNSDGLFVLSYRIVGDDSDATSSAPLMLLPRTFFNQVDQGVGGLLNITTIGNEEIITPSFLDIPEWHSSAVIPAGFESIFATQFARTYLMIPMHRQFVIDPENPGDFVYGGFLATTRSTDENFAQVRVSVSVLNTTGDQTGEFVMPSAMLQSTQIYDFLINTVSPRDLVPPSIVRALYDDLERRQIPLSPVHNSDGLVRNFQIVGDLPDGVINTFPVIQYRIQIDSGADAIIQVNAEDYVGPLVHNRRDLLFRSEDRLLSLGLTTLSKIALFVDNGNRTIGFGEPL